MIEFKSNPVNVGSSGGGPVVYPQTGDMVFTVIAVDTAKTEEDVFNNTSSYNKFNPDKPFNPRAAFYGVVFDAPNTKKLPEGYESSVLPFVLPPTPVAQLSGLFMDPDFGYGPTYIDENGIITKAGTMFKMVRTGTGLDTEYTVTALPATSPRYEKLSGPYTPPKETLKEFCSGYAARSRELYATAQGEVTAEAPNTADNV